MKKSTAISIFLIILGFIFEYLHLNTEYLFLNVKFGLLGIIFIFAGAISLWLFTILPILSKKKSVARK